MLLPKPCQRRRPAPKAVEGLQEGEDPREGGDSRGKTVGESIPEGGREGGDSRGKRVGESIPDGWRPEASPPVGLCLCLCLSLLQTLSHTQKDGETETVKT